MIHVATLSDSEDDLPIGDLIKKRGREGKLPTAQDIANKKSKTMAASVKRQEGKTKPAAISDNNQTPSMYRVTHMDLSEPTTTYSMSDIMREEEELEASHSATKTGTTCNNSQSHFLQDNDDDDDDREQQSLTDISQIRVKRILQHMSPNMNPARRHDISLVTTLGVRNERLLTDLSKQLKKVIDTDTTNTKQIDDILTLLEEVKIDRNLLKMTSVGRHVGLLRKHESTGIVEKANKLVNLWKAMVVEPVSSTSSISSSSSGVATLSSSSSKTASSRTSLGETRPTTSTSATIQARATIPAISFCETYTITLGDVAENHVGMQKIGTLASHGFGLSDLMTAKMWFEERKVECELVSLHELLPPELRRDDLLAYILVARRGLNALLHENEEDVTIEGEKKSIATADDFFKEQRSLNKDTKAFMYGRVVDKHARHNLCFAEVSQEPDYDKGQGRVVSFDEVPLLERVRENLAEVIGDAGQNLSAEGNYYYNPSKCGIGFHGDSERRKVVGVRVGVTMPLHLVWFQNSKPISERRIFQLGHGDVYMFSDKATGHDWKRKIVPTLRHAAGCQKFLDIKKAGDKPSSKK